MQSLPYSSLSESQRAQVAHLFADDVFGTDAGAFVYEVEGLEICGRRTIDDRPQTNKSRARQISPVNVTMLQEATITNGLIHSTHMHMDALAASVATRIHLNQEVPV